MSKLKTFDIGFYKILLIFLSIILMILYVPYWIRDKLFFYEFSDMGQIGDTLGGVLNPLIAIAASLLTFLAFWVQFKANDEVRNQFEVQQFESQFYEMMKLHKENVNELYLKIKKKIKHPDGSEEVVEDYIYGRRVFEFFEYELMIIYLVAMKNFKGNDITEKKLLNESYNVFFKGLVTPDEKKHPFFLELFELEKHIDDLDYDGFDKNLNAKLKTNSNTKFIFSKRIEFPIFKGHSNQLAHHYRHLFQTVKFVVSQDDKLLTYEKKRNYLRILRGQLSNPEQALLFYNWYSDFGKQWENESNKFFTDYRMIHNIYNDLLISNYKLENIFDIEKGYKKEKGRVTDNLFEFQDW